MSDTNKELNSAPSLVDGVSYCVMDYDLVTFRHNRVDPLEVRIAALEQIKGMDGRELELRKGLFPDSPDTPDDDDHRAVMWRLVAREGEPANPWNLLVFLREIRGADGDVGPQGPTGDPGPKGDTGQGVQIRNKVATAEDLLSLTSAMINGIYLALDTGNLWMFIGPTTAATGSWDNWKDLGPLAAQPGPKGDPGPRGIIGPRGPRGERGSDGSSISSFLVQWMVNAATSAAISGVMVEVNSAINDAINLMANQLATLAENAAEAAVNKAIDEMMDQFKGDKGEKGDKGDKGDSGKDGKSVRMVGQYDTLTTFMNRWPATLENVGVAALIGAEDAPARDLWAITSSGPEGSTPPPHYTYEKLGNIQGPKGDPGQDAVWDVSVRDTHFVEKHKIEVVSDLPPGVAGMYIQDTDSVFGRRVSWF